MFGYQDSWSISGNPPPPANWRAGVAERKRIHNSLQKEIQTPQFLGKFNRFNKSHRKLARFNTPQELIDFFHSRHSSPKQNSGQAGLPRNNQESTDVSHSNEILRPDPKGIGTQNDKEENQYYQLNPCPEFTLSFEGKLQRRRVWLKDKLFHLLVSCYRKKPETKPWLLTLLLVISWKQMEFTFSRFCHGMLNRINPYDSFAPVYESYIDAFLSVPVKSPRPVPSEEKTSKSHRNPSRRFALRIQCRAEYLIKREFHGCNNFKGEPDQNISAPECLPWQADVNEMIEEWVSKGILTKEQSQLVIYHTIYEYTFKEIAQKEGVEWRAIQKQYQRAINKLKPYLKGKYQI